jgi:hypothetical protein
LSWLRALIDMKRVVAIGASLWLEP